MSLFACIVAAAAAAAAGTARPARPSKPAPCNIEGYTARHADTLSDFNVQAIQGKKPTVLIKLAQPKGEEAIYPAALDGSPFAFYHAASATKSTKWTVYLQGGGW